MAQVRPRSTRTARPLRRGTGAARGSGAWTRARRIAATWLAAAACVLACAAGAEVADDVVRLQSALQQCRALVGPLREGAKALENKLKTCGKEAAESKAKYDQLQEQIRLDMNELKDLRERARHAEDSFSDKETSLTKLQRQLRDLRANNTKLVQLGKHLRAQNKRTVEELDDALALLEIEKTNTKEAQDALEAATGKTGDLEQKIKNLVGSDLHRRNTQLSDEVEELKRKLQEAEEAQTVLQGERDTATSSLKKARAELEQTTSKLEASSERVQDLGGRLTSVQADKDRLEVELDEKSSKLSEAQSSLDELASQKSSAEDRANELSKKQAAAAAESERLKTEFLKYKEKVDDPALVDYFVKKAEWLKNPKVEGVDRAYEKTLKMLGPRLDPAQEALLEMQTMLQASREKLSSAVGETDDSPFVSGLLTYGILLIPFGLSLCLLVRLKRCISLTKATMFMSMYNLIFCGLVFATSFALDGEEPMAAFRDRNESAFESLQIMLPIYFAVYIFFVLLLFTKMQINLRCRCSLRALLVLGLPVVVMVHYYRAVWLPSMRDEPPQMETTYWAAYAAAFLVHFGLITCCATASKPKDGDEDDLGLPLLAPSKKSHGHRVAEAQESQEGHVINVSADVMSPEEVTESLTEGAERVRDKASAIAESFKTGRSVKDIESDQRKSKKSKSKKKKKKPAHDDLESLEDRKVD